MPKGESGLAFASGTIDLLGFDHQGKIVHDPLADIEQLIQEKPDHPYAKLGIKTLLAAMNWFQQLTNSLELSYHPLKEHTNHQRITALGALRPSYLAPPSIIPIPIHHRVQQYQRIVVINIAGFRDFQPELVAANLRRQPAFKEACVSSHTITLPPSALKGRDPNATRSVELSRQLDNDEAISAIAKGIKSVTGSLSTTAIDLVVLPSVLSLEHGVERCHQLSQQLGCPVCEVATMPPSLPGLRLSSRLQRAFNHSGGLMMNGDQVQSGVLENQRITEIKTHGKSQVKLHAEHIILASGSFMSSGLLAERNAIIEPVFGLDVNTNLPRNLWANETFLNGKAHPFGHFGIVTDPLFRAFKAGQRIDNLYGVGSVLGHAQPVEEASSGGIAIGTGWAVAEHIIHQHTRQQETH